MTQKVSAPPHTITAANAEAATSYQKQLRASGSSNKTVEVRQADELDGNQEVRSGTRLVDMRLLRTLLLLQLLHVHEPPELEFLKGS